MNPELIEKISLKIKPGIKIRALKTHLAHHNLIRYELTQHLQEGWSFNCFKTRLTDKYGWKLSIDDLRVWQTIDPEFHNIRMQYDTYYAKQNKYARS